MDVLDLMETKLSSFTKTDRAVYERLKKHPKSFAHDSYDELTSALGVSPSALTRFAKKLGFSGYADLQYQLALDLEQRSHRSDDETVAQIFGSFLVETERTVDKAVLSRVAKRIVESRRVTCLGFNLSSLPAQFLCLGLKSKLGVDAECPPFDYVEHSYRDDETIVLFSVASGEWYRSFFQRMRSRTPDWQPYVVLVTMNQKHSLRRYCDELIVLPTAGKVSSSHTATLENMIFNLFSDMLIAECGKLSK